MSGLVLIVDGFLSHDLPIPRQGGRLGCCGWWTGAIAAPPLLRVRAGAVTGMAGATASGEQGVLVHVGRLDQGIQPGRA